MELLDKTVDNSNSFSMTDLLENYSEQPFLDDVHFTSHVCDKIAEFITHKIKLPSGRTINGVSRFREKANEPVSP
jgi:hypothetical protein